MHLPSRILKLDSALYIDNVNGKLDRAEIGLESILASLMANRDFFTVWDYFLLLCMCTQYTVLTGVNYFKHIIS